MFIFRSRFLYIFLFVISFPSLLAACSDVHLSDKGPGNETHPLAGRIWDIDQKQFISASDLANRLAGVDYLLLGERHDNMLHHQHQSWFIQQLHQQQLKASVNFEMIDLQQGQQLEQQRITSVTQLLQVLNQSDPGWQYDKHYKGLFAEVMHAGYPIHAANMSRGQLVQTVQQDKYNQFPAYQRMLNQVPLNATQSADLHTEIEVSHCNMLGEAAIGMMVKAQRLRDVVMAQSLLNSTSPVKVLVAGNGHVRNDRGVPIYLPENSEVLSVGFIEVDPNSENINNYSLPFDIAWFTPRIERGDPCEKFKPKQSSGMD